MAKIQARNVDDALFARIEQSAMKNERSLEGEVRLALARQYPVIPRVREPLTRREQWQRACGERLLASLERLSCDGFFPGSRHHGQLHLADLVRASHWLNVSPGLLMDCTDGTAELTQGLAERLESRSGVSAEWLTTGNGLMAGTLKQGGCIHTTGLFIIRVKCWHSAEKRLHDGSFWLHRKP
ncbi:TPA: hypothetical protein JC757_004851 [Salmonella enterica subsp. diarizonae]|nr:hypothetical protein [Salmonella enterica subsp. diarizonae]